MIQVNRVSTVGFTTVESLIEGLDDFAGYQLKVQAKNENYIAQSFDVSSGKVVEGPVLATTPDLICIIDSDTGELVRVLSLICVIVIGDVALSVASNVDKIADVQHATVRQTTMRVHFVQ